MKDIEALETTNTMSVWYGLLDESAQLAFVKPWQLV